jgi:uncharacterized membrane protein
LGIFSFLRKKTEFFSPEEKQLITEAVQKAEKETSGEVRVFVENRCRFVDALDRAVEIFQQLKMEQTKDRNAVLLYVAMKDRQLAIFGDEGIHQRVGNEYWQKEVRKMIKEFNRSHYAQGICKCVQEIGNALKTNFPYDANTDKNELPDDIVFGK